MVTSRTDRQKLAIKKWISSGGKGSWVFATGFGKTFASVQLIQLLVNANAKAHIIIVVPTDYLKEQWLDYIVKYDLINNCVVEIINSAIKIEQSCDLLILDECHLYASDSFKRVFDVISYNTILCLTATMHRLDGKDVIIQKYAPICDEISLQEAERNGWVSPVKEYLVLLDVDLSEYNEWNRKFNAHFALFNWEYATAMKACKDWKFRNTYAKQIGSEPKVILAAAMEWMRAMRKRKEFVQNHPKKIEICKKILNARQDKKCITFSATIADAEKIKMGDVVHSKQSKKHNSEIISKFNNAESGVLCTSKSADQGVDIKGLSVGIIMSVDSSRIRKTQRVGRVIRFEEGKCAEMFTLVIRGTQELNWFNNSKSGNVITISEQELDAVLNGDFIETRERDITTDKNYRF